MIKTRKNGGFTLIEVLVVVIILGALIAVVVPNLMDVPDRAKAQLASVSMEQIGVALKLYRLDMGTYPKDIMDLRKAPGVVGRTRPYLEKDPDDPWGSRFCYKFPGVHNPLDYDLYSIGPDKSDSTSDDIGNWKKQ